MEYKLANGYVLSDEEIEERASRYENGNWEGELEMIKPGRPSVSDEEMVTVAVKMPSSMVAAMDRKSNNRSDFIRKAVAACL